MKGGRGETGEYREEVLRRNVSRKAQGDRYSNMMNSAWHASTLPHRQARRFTFKGPCNEESVGGLRVL